MTVWYFFNQASFNRSCCVLTWFFHNPFSKRHMQNRTRVRNGAHSILYEENILIIRGWSRQSQKKEKSVGIFFFRTMPEALCSRRKTPSSYSERSAFFDTANTNVLVFLMVQRKGGFNYLKRDTCGSLFWKKTDAGHTRKKRMGWTHSG
jgi:hypothetical protein